MPTSPKPQKMSINNKFTTIKAFQQDQKYQPNLTIEDTKHHCAVSIEKTILMLAEMVHSAHLLMVSRTLDIRNNSKMMKTAKDQNHPSKKPMLTKLQKSDQLTSKSKINLYQIQTNADLVVI